MKNKEGLIMIYVWFALVYFVFEGKSQIYAPPPPLELVFGGRGVVTGGFLPAILIFGGSI